MVRGKLVSKEEIIKKIKQDMKEKGYLNKYSGCLSKNNYGKKKD